MSDIMRSAADLRAYFAERRIILVDGKRGCFTNKKHPDIKVKSTGKCATCTWKEQQRSRQRFLEQGLPYPPDVAMRRRIVEDRKAAKILAAAVAGHPFAKLLD